MFEISTDIQVSWGLVILLHEDKEKIIESSWCLRGSYHTVGTMIPEINAKEFPPRDQGGKELACLDLTLNKSASSAPTIHTTTPLLQLRVYIIQGPSFLAATMLVSLTVGKVDAGLAILLTEEKRLVGLTASVAEQAALLSESI